MASLRIVAYSQVTDGGLYECQISTTPIMSHYVYLQVSGQLLLSLVFVIWIWISDPETKILGGPDIYFKEGDTMNITCLVKDSPEPPQFIFWYHEEQVETKSFELTLTLVLVQTISYASPRGGISQITEKGDVTASFLLIQKARTTDSGLYSSKPSIGNMALVNVHIVRSKAGANNWLI